MNEVTADAWSHPRSDNPDEPQSCDARDAFGATCRRSPRTSPRTVSSSRLSRTRPRTERSTAATRSRRCSRDPITGAPTPSEPLLTPGDYVVEVVPPAFYQVIKEEDQNTDEGDVLVPQIPPPPCVGPLHAVDDARNPADGQDTPLCNKKLVTLDDGQNPAADFFLFTDVDDDPTTNTAKDGSWTTIDSVAPPGRIFGFVGDDLRFDTDQKSPWFGQPLALPNIPVGVYDYNGRLHDDAPHRRARFLRRRSPVHPDLQLPDAVRGLPGHVRARIDDPADPAFNPDYLTARSPSTSGPARRRTRTRRVDPIAALPCNLGVLPEGGQAPVPRVLAGRPEPVHPAHRRRCPARADAQRDRLRRLPRTPGRVTIGGVALPASAYLSWNNREIRIRVPSACVPAGRVSC